jgi:four helix bundle protein
MSDDAGRPLVDLRARTKAFALRVIRLVQSLPRTPVGRVLGDRALRSGTSIGAHYREASRGRSTAESASELNTGIQELDEAMYWMELIVEAGLVKPARMTAIQDEADQLLRILVAMTKNAKRGC